MSITNLSNTVTYIGDGSTVGFTYSFPLQNVSDMQVWITDPAGIVTQIFTNFEVDTVNLRVLYPTIGSPLPADGSKITLLRVVPLTQETVLTDTGPLPATVLETAYDKLTMMIQQFVEVLGRTLQFPVGTTPDPTLSATLLAEIEAAGANAAAAAASAAAAAASAASIANPIPIARGGTNSQTALVNGKFMQSSGGKIVESTIDVASFAGVPAGASMDFRGTSAPTGWLLEDGSAVSRTTYATLFAVIGTSYGVGNGTTTFNVPDSRGRVNIGSGTGAGLSARTVVQTGGEETHTLLTGEMPLHTHSVTDPQHTHAGTYPKDINALSGTGGYGISGVRGIDSKAENAYVTPQGIPSASTGITIQNAGFDGAHNNMQPFLVALKIIKT
jgi:microcystin-dependent protein